MGSAPMSLMMSLLLDRDQSALTRYLAAAHRRHVELYCAQLRGRSDGWWDRVVLTAADAAQARAFRAQIDARLRAGTLPRHVAFDVTADPPGPKIGNGGATIYALKDLMARGVRIEDGARRPLLAYLHAMWADMGCRKDFAAACGRL